MTEKAATPIAADPVKVDPRVAARQKSEEEAFVKNLSPTERAAYDRRKAANADALAAPPVEVTPQPTGPPAQPVHEPATQVPGVHAGEGRRAQPVARPRPSGPAVRVRAFRMGYYGDMLRRVGDVFTVTDPAMFTSTWMERVHEHTPEQRTTASEELRRSQLQMQREATPLGERVDPDTGEPLKGLHDDPGLDG